MIDILEIFSAISIVSRNIGLRFDQWNNIWIVMQTYLAPGSIEYLDLRRHIVDGDAVPVEEICDKR